MSKQILVAYASGAGSTAEVAAAIGEVLDDAEVTVEVRAVNEVNDLTSYAAVIVGSSIRLGRWLPAAVTFLTDFEDALATRPVALFTTCLTMVEESAESRRTVLAYMAPLLAQVPALNPVGIGLFAGSLDPNFGLLVPAGAGPYGDFRNWDAIRAWAAAVRPRLLTGEEPRQHSPVQELSNVILAYTDLAHSDLSNVDLHGSDLHRADLHETTLAESDLRETDLTHSDLHGSNLAEADLHWATVTAGNLRHADLQGANLVGANLSQADLTGTNLHRAILNGAQLKGANLTEANLSHADLNWVDFSEANLTHADLRHAQLGWTNLATADLTDCNLQDAQYNDYTQWPVGFAPEAAGCRYVGWQR